jgi:hypothetical protein
VYSTESFEGIRAYLNKGQLLVSVNRVLVGVAMLRLKSKYLVAVKPEYLSDL